MCEFESSGVQDFENVAKVQLSEVRSVSKRSEGKLGILCLNTHKQDFCVLIVRRNIIKHSR